ncbi:MAG: PhnD/SsuA/transferrin family substrate-binding protein [Bavariicoccus seileri]|uniref:phosphate/phosphite/phosphonate ABC transporter substrate-binding protein n=1 Tax=Bavariicoccus seileri TaxID=549685 RepID=UPI003F943FBC
MSSKWKTVLLAAVAGTTLLAGCGNNNSEGGDEGSSSENKTIDELSIGFVPSRTPEEITAATEPLGDLLKTALKDQGYEVNKIDISVGTSYEGVGEALSAGTTDIGFIPGGTYVLYDDGAEVLLTATRDGLSIDSEDPKDWNDNKPTVQEEGTQVTYYKSLIIAGPSEKGQELGKKINNGEELSWDDLNSATWSVMGPSSSSGYIYPYMWLEDNYGKTINDLDNVVKADSYGSSMARLASGQVDIVVGYADLRIDNAEPWTSEFGRSEDIFDETNVIGVSPNIYNDTISVSKNSDKMTPEFKEALQKAFIELAKTDEGKEVISIYSHTGYEPAKDSDYDGERKAQEIVKNQ